MTLVTSIKLNLAKKLKEDKEFRKQFFRLRIKDEIASSIIELRKKRAMRQVDLAKHADMKQSAISRIEQADYSGYYQTLLRIAEALDSRLHVGFEPMEDVIRQYEEKEASTDNLYATSDTFALDNLYNIYESENKTETETIKTSTTQDNGIVNMAFVSNS